MGIVSRLTTVDPSGGSSPKPERMNPLDRLCQYVLVLRLAVAGLALLVMQHQPPVQPVLIVAVLVILTLNYLGLRRWLVVTGELRLADKPWYLVLDVCLAGTLVAISGVATPMVLYLVGAGLLAGLVYTARLAITATLVMTLAYLAVLTGHSGSAPGVIDIHTVLTLPALMVAAGPIGVALRRLLEQTDRAARQVSSLREEGAVNQERLRVARDLHDTVTKDLHGIWLLSRGLSATLARGDLARAHQVAEMVEQTAQGLSAHARTVIHDLREVDESPLTQALSRTALEGLRGSDTVLDLRLPDDLDVAAADLGPTRAHLLAVVGEAVHNSAKHARAAHLSLTAGFNSEWLTVSVADDGVGFEPPQVSPDPVGGAEQHGHYGLTGMRERVTAVGGHLELASAPGHGTTVTARLPLRCRTSPTRGVLIDVR
jgi:signal transduction histidine kinase